MNLFSALAAVLTYSRILSNSSVLIVIDNNTDVAIINRQATRSARLALLLRALYDLCSRINCSVTAIHRAGHLNVVADYLSRPALHGNDPLANWTHTDIFAMLRCVFLSSSQICLRELNSLENRNYQHWLHCLVNYRSS